MRNLLKTPILLLLFLSFSLGGCSLLDVALLPEPEDSAQDLFEAGNDALADKDYASSVKYFTKLKENFPFSPYSIEAELSLADAYYLDGEWLQASEAYKEFADLHPRHQAMAYVLYQVGMSDMNTYTSVDRPPTLVEEAYTYFERVRDQYPSDEYAQKATEQMQKCRVMLAQYEIYRGDLFFRMGQYGGAWMRYKTVVDEYSDVPELYDYAQEKMKAAYLLRSQDDSEEIREAKEGSWKDYFKWL